MEVVELTLDDFAAVVGEEALGYTGALSPCSTDSMDIFGLVYILKGLGVFLLLDKVNSDVDSVVPVPDLRYWPWVFAKQMRRLDLKGPLGQIWKGMESQCLERVSAEMMRGFDHM